MVLVSHNSYGPDLNPDPYYQLIFECVDEQQVLLAINSVPFDYLLSAGLVVCPNYSQ